MPLSKKKEKMTIEKRKGIDLLTEVALTEEAQSKEVKKKSLRYFHKTHPSGSGIVTKTAPSAAKIKPSVTNEGTGVKPGVPDVTEEESSESETEFWEMMKMTSIMNKIIEVKKVVKRMTVMIRIPTLTMKKGQIPSMKLMRC
nr:hypothetical protein [Tanacetum cinerariifolium]